MKIVITMKSPNAIWGAVHEAARTAAVPGESPADLERRREDICRVLDKFVENRDRLNIEFDLSAETVRVISNEEWATYALQEAPAEGATPET